MLGSFQKLFLIMMTLLSLSANAQLDKKMASESYKMTFLNPKKGLIIEQTYVWYDKNHSREDDEEVKSKIGWVYPLRSIVQQIKKFADGRKGFDVTYSINQLGLRSSGGQLKKAQHLILAGDSNTFGVGLNEQETLSWIMSQKYPLYDVYNFGLGGGGPHNSLALLEKTPWQTMIQEPSGRMIYIFYVNWMAIRVVGTKSYLEWDKGVSPWYELENDELVYKGRFQDRLLSKILRFITLIDHFKWVGELPRLNVDHMKLVAKIFEKMKAEYLHKFPQGQFTVALSYYGIENPSLGNELGNLLKKYGIETVAINSDQKNNEVFHLIDSHFNYEGQKMIEKELSRAIKL